MLDLVNEGLLNGIWEIIIVELYDGGTFNGSSPKLVRVDI